MSLMMDSYCLFLTLTLWGLIKKCSYDLKPQM